MRGSSWGCWCYPLALIIWFSYLWRSSCHSRLRSRCSMLWLLRTYSYFLFKTISCHWHCNPRRCISWTLRLRTYIVIWIFYILFLTLPRWRSNWYFGNISLSHIRLAHGTATLIIRIVILDLSNSRYLILRIQWTYHSLYLPIFHFNSFHQWSWLQTGGQKPTMSTFWPISLTYLLSRVWKLPSVLEPGLFPTISLLFKFCSASALFVLKYDVFVAEP